MSTLFARLCGYLGMVFAAGLLALTPASGQQTCREIDAVLIWCSGDPEERISGEPPHCFCDGVPIEPPLELTCARNFGCPDATFVGEGDFPECFCRKLKDSGGSGGGGTGGGGSGGGGGIGGGGIGSSLGGVATCAQFFQCPQGAEMVVEEGQCMCDLRMMPLVNE